MPSSSMIAAVVEQENGPFVLRELARPTPAPGEVLVRIEASGTNPLDTKIRAGQAAHARQPLPATLGMDLAGTVVALGASVDRFAVGEAVYGFGGGVGGLQGSHAQYGAFDARLLARKPASLSMGEAAILPLVVITAWEGLVDRARIRAGQTVLIQGGAGGVGQVAVQIALARGAKVFATDVGAELDFVRAMGAVAIDAKRDVASYVAEHTEGQGFDLVYDTVGGPVLDASIEAVRRFGHVVSCLGWGTHKLAPLSFKQATYSGVFTLHPLIANEGRAHFGDILEEARKLVDAGRLVPRLDPRAFTLEDLGAAYDAVLGANGAPRQRGKIAVTMS
ncbi:zinc-dependent alcohol dehydrogenase family protein [Sphingomonas sp. KRR8]|uniref:zinc-dependent alcohol dehydrogenase family protein n=1 Tax=Sphingomonas sp. KRR8 TaxID=2942996 RepID=UPI002022467B|nr:zinc-dependent alcohol dehydrogenase family protein [Sphingomonas sp. KRR8]URD59815.1 zinc-dependent alcohol dehydrogenase family protein [Sphingomonas sp. KRR8]